MEKQKKNLKTETAPQNDTLIYVAMPTKLKMQVEKLIKDKKIEDASDLRWAQEAIINSQDNTVSTVEWFEKLVARKGKKFVA